MPRKTDDNTGELRKWRAGHFAELEKTLAVLISIRDGAAIVPIKCPKCKALVELSVVTAKDKIEASKGIGRLLAGLSPDKVTALASDEKDSASISRRNIPKLSPALKARLSAVLNNAPK
jgi:hypothetical protein